MSTTVRNTFLGMMVAFVVGFGLRLLPVLLDARDLGASVTTVPLMLGMMTIFILNGVSSNRKVANADEDTAIHARPFAAKPGAISMSNQTGSSERHR